MKSNQTILGDSSIEEPKEEIYFVECYPSGEKLKMEEETNQFCFYLYRRQKSPNQLVQTNNKSELFSERN